MHSKAINLVARRISSAYLQYKDHPCIANQAALFSSLEVLINNIEEAESLLHSGNSHQLSEPFQL